jgi:hypothetical protein
VIHVKWQPSSAQRHDEVIQTTQCSKEDTNEHTRIYDLY